MESRQGAMDIPRRQRGLDLRGDSIVGAGLALKVWDILQPELDSTIASAVPLAPDIRP